MFETLDEQRGFLRKTNMFTELRRKWNSPVISCKKHLHKRVHANKVAPKNASCGKSAKVIMKRITVLHLINVVNLLMY